MSDFDIIAIYMYHISAINMVKILCFRSPPTPLHLRLCLGNLAKTSYFWTSVSKLAPGKQLTKNDLSEKKC